MSSILKFEKISDHELCVSGCDKDVVKVKIPQHFDGVKVTEIGDQWGSYQAFASCRKLVSIEIPEGIVGVGWNAFMNCKSLTSVKLPRSLRWMTSPFEGCVSLTEIVVHPENENFKMVDGKLFSFDLEKMFYSPDITAGGLADVTVPRHVKRMDALRSRCSTIKTVTLNQDTSGDFGALTSLTEMVFPEGNYHWDDYSFAGCCNLRCLTFYGKVDGFEKGAFAGCPITEVTIRACRITMRYAGRSNIKILEGETKIGDWMFSGSRVKRVILPKSIYSIAGNAFFDCQNLVEVQVHPENPNFYSLNGALYCKKTDRLLVQPEGR
ncbi:leucine-rich repeat domain-containing protein [Mariniblastus sp.]|nr:leucine-rich repeat domain-containing protein [Mariniblastus sp.]